MKPGTGVGGRSRAVFGVALGLSLLFAPACTVRFISEHDPVLDERTSELNERVESFFLRMEAATEQGSPALPWQVHQGFYLDTRAEVTTLRMRAEATPQAELLARHYELIGENVENLARLHREGGEKGLTPAVLGPAREALRMQFRAVLKLLAGLRRGED